MVIRKRPIKARQLPSIDISYYLSIASNATSSFGVDVTRPNINPIQSQKNSLFRAYSQIESFLFNSVDRRNYEIDKEAN